MQVTAFAKINLGLAVLGCRADGYHEVDMVMQAVSLGDVLTLELAETICVEVNCPELAGGPDNLAYRAAALLQKVTGQRRGVRIYIEKNIPLAAGLAGGSADAAAVLRGLNQLWDLGLSLGELMELGAALGSDVPFGLVGGTARARGRGEVVEPLPALVGRGVVLVKPAFGVSTPRVYRLHDQLPPRPPGELAPLLAALEQGDWAGLCAALVNDLERATFTLHPELAAIKQALQEAGASGVLMSGSGPTVFGLCADEPAARRVAAGLDLAGCRVDVAVTL
ncbi:MAG: 4-(cytidine 5'-diphospho)-2-C-methyl-D-erythritol kinase [Desulfurispora sp.]|uniref:4-(cytidine 5'-diphospho)-2-C-methyl-D-erythritol kinase n=1 Tax=Desulfurispora sp. TaxID=3014275 RepID=UPI004049D58A